MGQLPATHRSLRSDPPQTAPQIVNCTTPANYYHVLRRQVHRQFRKPLVSGHVVMAWLGGVGCVCTAGGEVRRQLRKLLVSEVVA